MIPCAVFAQGIFLKKLEKWLDIWAHPCYNSFMKAR
nr:MAG TPA: hypothetical protein [Caudoviricetes sp.]